MQLLREWTTVRCPPDRTGAVERLRGIVGDFDPARWLIGLAAELQLQATGFRARSWKRVEPDAGESGTAGRMLAAIECESHVVAEACVDAAWRILNRIAEAAPGRISDEIAALQEIAEQNRLFESDRYLIHEAGRRHIPIHRLREGSTMQLGEGAYQRRVRLSLSSGTSLLAGQTANDKLLVKSIWAQLGLPVPRGREVIDADDAVAAADELGGQVVVKPRDADYGNGVTLRLRDPDAIRAAFELARQESEHVLVERFLEGTLHRLLIVQGELVSAIRREPATIVGDGIQTIETLVEIENATPERGDDFRWRLQKMALGARENGVLASQGLTKESIPSAGERIRLRDDPRIGAGGATIDVTRNVHPHTHTVAIEAVRAVGLDIAGVDLVATDISRPLGLQGGGLLEVNEEPALYIHLPPFCAGDPERVVRAVLQAQYPRRRSGRLPVVVAPGSVAANELVEQVVQRWSAGTLPIGCSTPFRTEIGGRELNPASTSPGDRWRTLVLDSTIRRAAISADWGSLATQGLGIDQMRTLVLADSSELGDLTPDLREKVWRWINRASGRAQFLIVNYDDPIWGARAWKPFQRVISVARNPQHPAIVRQQRCGGLWGSQNGAELVLGRGTNTIAVWPSGTHAPQSLRHELLVFAANWTIGSTNTLPAQIEPTRERQLEEHTLLPSEAHESRRIFLAANR